MFVTRLDGGVRPAGIAGRLSAFAVAAASTLIAGPVLAASGSWSATTSGTWSDAANWDGGTIANGAGFTGTFASDITSAVTVTLDSNRTLNTVVFGDANPATAGTWIIASLQAAAEFERLILTPAPANATGTATFTVNGNTTVTMTAPLEVSNNGGVFVKNGTGTLILPNTLANPDPNRNRIGGKTAIMGGTVQIASDFSLGGQPGSYSPDHLMISGGGTLRTNGTLTLGNNRGVTIGVGGGTLSVNGGMLTYSGRFSGPGETLTTTGAAGISLRNTSGSPSDVNWDFSGKASRIFFRNTNALGSGSVRVRDAVRLVSESAAIGVVTNAVTVDSGGGISARSGAVTFENVVLPSAGSVILNKDDALTFGLTIFSNTDLTGDLTVDTSQGGATNPVGDVTLTGVFSGTGGLVKAGTGASGRLILAGANTYTGTTSVTTGTLHVNGDQSLATGPVVVAAAATLGGTGTVGGATTIESGATLSPGSSPGTLSFTQGVTLAGGANYNWQLYDAAGTAGSTTGWDLLSVGGALDIAATAESRFNVNLWSLSGVGPDVNGSAVNFNSAQNGSWKIASAAGGITGFAADKFTINTAATNGTAGFTNDLAGGSFAVVQDGNDLLLQFTAGGGPTPEPVKITGVYVKGSGWSTGYLDRSPFSNVQGATAGWELPDGPAQLANASNVAWNNVDTITIEFDQPITQPDAAALQLVRGTTEGNQTIVPTLAPTLLGDGSVAQWTLPAGFAELQRGKYVISIAADGITNADGTTILDGDWITGVSTFAQGSGDGQAGGTFNFFFNSLVGDVNGDGVMNAGDLSAIRNALTSPLNTPLLADSSNYRLDIDGLNSLNSADLSKTRNQLSSALGTQLASLPSVTAPTAGGNLSIAPVPEPATSAMALAGLACGGFSIWRRRKRD